MVSVETGAKRKATPARSVAPLRHIAVEGDVRQRNISCVAQGHAGARGRTAKVKARARCTAERPVIAKNYIAEYEGVCRILGGGIEAHVDEHAAAETEEGINPTAGWNASPHTVLND